MVRKTYNDSGAIGGKLYSMPTLTIYTCTYNRSHLLPRLYESLQEQTCKDFLWLIIDDGSTDGTKSLVDRWILEENEFEIRFFYKSNGGIHTARDAAYRLCDTELLMSEDSDDWLYKNAVEVVLNKWKSRPEGTYAGILTHEDYPNGENICPTFPENIDVAILQDFIYKYKCKGEKYTVVRADLMKAIPDAPIFDGEKLVGENYKWMQLPDIPFLLMNTSIGVKDFQDAGLTKTSSNYFFNNPKGFRAVRTVYIKNGKYLEARIKGHLGYIASCIYLREYSQILRSPHPFWSFLLLPAGIASYCFLLARRRKVAHMN